MLTPEQQAVVHKAEIIGNKFQLEYQLGNGCYG
jgi:hypothetical protein